MLIYIAIIYHAQYPHSEFNFTMYKYNYTINQHLNHNHVQDIVYALALGTYVEPYQN